MTDLREIMRKRFNPSRERSADQSPDRDSVTSSSSDVVNDLTGSSPPSSDPYHDSRRQNADTDLNKLFGRAFKSKPPSHSSKQSGYPARTMPETANSDSASEEDSDDPNLKATKKSSRSQNTSEVRRRQVSKRSGSPEPVSDPFQKLKSTSRTPRSGDSKIHVYSEEDKQEIYSRVSSGRDYDVDVVDDNNPFAKLVADVSKSDVGKPKHSDNDHLLIGNSKTARSKEKDARSRNEQDDPHSHASEAKDESGDEKESKKAEKVRRRRNIREEDMPIRELFAHNSDSDDDDDSDGENPYLQIVPQSLRTDLQPKPGSGGAPGAVGAAGVPGASGAPGGGGVVGTAFGLPGNTGGASSAQRSGVTDLTTEQLDETMGDIEELLKAYKKGKKKTKRDEEDDKLMEEVKRLMEEHPPIPASARPDIALLGPETDQLREQLMAGLGQGEQGLSDQAYQLQQTLGGLGGDQTNQLRQMMGGLGGDQANQLRQMMGGQGGDQANQLRQLLGGGGLGGLGGLGEDQANQLRQMMGGLGGDQANQMRQMMQGARGRGGDQLGQLMNGAGLGGLGRGRGTRMAGGQIGGDGEEDINVVNPDEREIMNQLLAMESIKAQNSSASKAREGMNTIIIIDISNSMAGDGILQATGFLTEFLNGLEHIRYALNLDENVALVTVGESVEVAQHFTNDYSQIRAILHGIYSNGPTKLHQALLLPLCIFPSAASRGIQNFGSHVAAPRVILISDGRISMRPDDSQQAQEVNPLQNEALNSTTTATQMTMCQLTCIPVGNCNREFLTLLAQSTGGQMYERARATQLSRWHLYHVVVALLKQLGQSEPARDSIQQILSSRLGQCEGTDVDEVLTLWRQPEPDLAAFQRRLEQRAAGNQQGQEGMRMGGQGIGTSGIGGMPTMGRGRGMNPAVPEGLGIPRSNRGLAPADMSRGSDRPQTGFQVHLGQVGRSDDSTGLPSVGRGVGGLSEGSGRGRLRSFNNDRDDVFNIGMRDMFHMNDFAVAQRRRILEEERAEMDKREKLPPEQLRLEKLPDTGKAQWPSKDQLKPSHRLEREVTTTTMASEVSYPTLRTRASGNGTSDQAKPGWRIKHQPNLGQFQDHNPDDSGSVSYDTD